MINYDVRSKLLVLIKENMIIEYEKFKIYKKDLKEKYIDCLENDFLTERDKELILKYPPCIKMSDRVSIVYYYQSGIDIERCNVYNILYKEDDLIIRFDKKYPKICDTIYSLKENSVIWTKIGPTFYQYLNARNAVVRKINLADDFLGHKNTTITLIKKEFPELYKLYKP